MEKSEIELGLLLCSIFPNSEPILPSLKSKSGYSITIFSIYRLKLYSLYP